MTPFRAVGAGVSGRLPRREQPGEHALLPGHESQQPRGIVGHDRFPHARPSVQFLAPGGQLRLALEYAEIDPLLEDVLIAEDRREDGVDQAETGTGIERPPAQLALDAP